MEKRKYLTVDQVAREMECHRRTIYRMIERGEIIAFPWPRPGGRIRILRASLEAHIRKITTEHQENNGILPISEKNCD
jgi:excisionase family DNA binding protein